MICPVILSTCGHLWRANLLRDLQHIRMGQRGNCVRVVSMKVQCTSRLYLRTRLPFHPRSYLTCAAESGVRSRTTHYHYPPPYITRLTTPHHMYICLHVYTTHARTHARLCSRSCLTDFVVCTRRRKSVQKRTM